MKAQFISLHSRLGGLHLTLLATGGVLCICTRGGQLMTRSRRSRQDGAAAPFSEASEPAAKLQARRVKNKAEWSPATPSNASGGANPTYVFFRRPFFSTLLGLTSPAPPPPPSSSNLSNLYSFQLWKHKSVQTGKSCTTANDRAGGARKPHTAVTPPAGIFWVEESLIIREPPPALPTKAVDFNSQHLRDVERGAGGAERLSPRREKKRLICPLVLNVYVQ